MLLPNKLGDGNRQFGIGSFAEQSAYGGLEYAHREYYYYQRYSH